jgi:chromosome segregation ATPase
MLDPLLNFVTGEPVLVACMGGALFVCLCLGWSLKGIRAARFEATLKQAVLESKRSIPQFETSVRSREQQIERLQLELSSLQGRIGELDHNVAEKSAEMRTQAREMRVLTTELSAAKRVQGDDGLLLDGIDLDDGDGAAEHADPEMQARVNMAEALYEQLRHTLAEREDRIAQLELQLESPDEQSLVAGPGELDGSTGTVRLLEDRISVREGTIERLEAQLSELRQDREMLSDLARSRSKTNQSVKAEEAERPSRIPELENEIEHLGQVVVDREASVKQLLGELEEANKDKRHQQEQNLSCVDEISTQGEMREVLEARLKSLTEDAETLQLTIRDQRYSLEQNESWLSKFKVAAGKRSQELASVTAERDALAEQLADVNGVKLTPVEAGL